MANWEPSADIDNWPGCLGCVHYQRMRCVAYPERIPFPIASGQVDHLVPRPGQVGDTVFQLMDFEWWQKTGERRPLKVGASADTR